MGTKSSTRKTRRGTSALRAIAVAQANDVARVERLASLEVRKILSRFKIVATRRALRGDTSMITQKEIGALVETFAKSLTLAETLGARRVQQALKMSALDDIVAKMAYSRNFSKALTIVTEYTQRVNADIEDFTRDLITQQLPTATATKLLAERFNKLGVSPTNAFQLENIVRTQSQIAYNSAKWKEEQQPYVQDILWGYVYLTVGDERVRESHQVLDGTKLPKDDPFWLRFYPPNGYSCRCQAVPIFDDATPVAAPPDAAPDPGFEFNPGTLLGIK
jgi:SPP1 gp7 family putative phage head morphogenesis protein